MEQEQYHRVELVPDKPVKSRLNKITTVVLWIMIVCFAIRILTSIINRSMGFYISLTSQLISTINIVYYFFMAIALLIMATNQKSKTFWLLISVYAVSILKPILCTLPYLSMDTDISLAYIFGTMAGGTVVTLVALTGAMLCTYDNRTGFRIIYENSFKAE